MAAQAALEIIGASTVTMSTSPTHPFVAAHKPRATPPLAHFQSPPAAAAPTATNAVPAAVPIAKPTPVVANAAPTDTSTAPPVIPMAPILPASRPPAKLPAEKPAAKAAAKKGAGKATSVAQAGKKEEAAKQAQAAAAATEGVKKRRGRPPKTTTMPTLANVTNAASVAATLALTDEEMEQTGPIHLCTVVGNNRAEARRAAAREKAAQDQAAEDVRAAEMARGWQLGKEEGTVIFTRVRKPRVLPDGTVAQPLVKKRAPQLDASEKALLARTAGKRKAAPAGAEQAGGSKK